MSCLNSGLNIITTLSTAEMRVAAMIKNGLTSKEIATKLSISVDTVKTHRKNIRKKLNIQNASIDLANYLRLNWV
jgi:DNA-binding CsgD family transcriptional regulator